MPLLTKVRNQDLLQRATAKTVEITLHNIYILIHDVTHIIYQAAQFRPQNFFSLSHYKDS
jgi:hypothetical protein